MEQKYGAILMKAGLFENVMISHVERSIIGDRRRQFKLFNASHIIVSDKLEEITSMSLRSTRFTIAVQDNVEYKKRDSSPDMLSRAAPFFLVHFLTQEIAFAHTQPHRPIHPLLISAFDTD